MWDPRGTSRCLLQRVREVGGVGMGSSYSSYSSYSYNSFRRKEWVKQGKHI